MTKLVRCFFLFLGAVAFSQTAERIWTETPHSAFTDFVRLQDRLV